MKLRWTRFVFAEATVDASDPDERIHEAEGEQTPLSVVGGGVEPKRLLEETNQISPTVFSLYEPYRCHAKDHDDYLRNVF